MTIASKQRVSRWGCKRAILKWKEYRHVGVMGSGTDTLALESWLWKAHSVFAHSSKRWYSLHSPNDCRLQWWHVADPYPDTWQRNLGLH